MSTNYVIWSFEHQQWWRAERCGYTESLDEAGRYTAAEAGDIVANAYVGEHVMLHEATAARFGAPTVPNLWAACEVSDKPEDDEGPNDITGHTQW